MESSSAEDIPGYYFQNPSQSLTSKDEDPSVDSSFEERQALMGKTTHEVPNIKKDIWLRQDILGKGAFGRVYKVQDLKSGDFYAAKFSGSESMFENKNRTYLEAEKVKKEIMKANDALENEIEIHSKLSHPNIVQYITHFHTKSCYQEGEIVVVPYEHGICQVLVLELCPDKSLEKMLETRKRLSEIEAKFITYKLGQALSYLKKNNISHRDLKPANIMLCEDKNVKDGLVPKLADFGLSIVGFTYKVSGTPRYMAPESVRGNLQGPEADVWALGVTLFKMISGKMPFGGQNRSQLFNNISKVNYSINKSDGFSKDVADLINKIFVEEPSKRITIDELLVHPAFVKAPMLEKLPYESRATNPFPETHKNVIDAVKECDIDKVRDLEDELRDANVDIFQLVKCILKEMGMEVTKSPTGLYAIRAQEVGQHLVYQLSNGLYGMQFNDGTSLQRLSKDDVVYITKNDMIVYKDTVPKELSAKVKIFRDALDILRNTKGFLSKVTKTPATTYVKLFSRIEDMLMLLFDTEDTLQFIFDDGSTMIFFKYGLYVTYIQNESPIDIYKRFKQIQEVIDYL